MKKSSLKSRTLLLVLRQNGLSTMTAALRHWVHAILPLSSCSRSTRMLFRGIMCCALIVVCVSCKSHKYGLDALRAVQDSVTLYSVVRSVDTVVVRDSVYVREVMRGDTVYLTRLEWRDRWRTRIERDTVVDVRIEKEVVQLPPERYVPKFYKWCTGLLWVIVTLAIGYWLLRWRLR